MVVMAEKTTKYLLAIVVIVAVVGIFILVLNAASVSFDSEDYVCWRGVCVCKNLCF